MNALRCPKCEITAGARGESTAMVGMHLRATGETHERTLISGKPRTAARLVCQDCDHAWSTIHPDAIAMAEAVQRGEVTYIEHAEPEEVDL